MIELNKVLCGKMEVVLKDFPDNFFHSIVTDPPYGISFMNKHWDYDVPSVAQWKEAYRVLKPGGYLLSFGGTRTYHRMVVNIEDAGFEIRDQIMWLYGSGFPKSLDISKAIDSKLGAKRNVIGEKIRGDVQKAKEKGAGYLADVANRNNTKQFGYGVEELTEASSDEAKKWEGWGTALKPANEPICVARKPISEKTVAENILKWGTGGINIDACRIETDEKLNIGSNNRSNAAINYGMKDNKEAQEQNALGRFPANLILDEFIAGELDKQSGISKSAGHFPKNHTTGNGIQFTSQHLQEESFLEDTGGASRFFYVAKPSQYERSKGCGHLKAVTPSEKTGRKEGSKGVSGSIEHGNSANPFANGGGISRNGHPTVKPIDLMRYLVKLVTPKGGICLDPFAGSGTTLAACKLEFINFIGIELEKDFCAISEARIAAWNPEKYKLQTIF